MTVREIAKSLSPAARTALEGMGSHLIGTTVPGLADMERRELRHYGVTGLAGGLTIKGSAVAEIVQREALDRMFG